MYLKVCFLGLFLSFQVHAASDTYEKKRALNVVRNYANSIACNTTFERDQNKIQTTIDDVFIIHKGVEEGAYNEFFVLWSGDQQCAGGSATYLSTLTRVIKWSKNKPYIVTGDYPFGEEVDKHINYRFINNFKQLSPNLFKIISGKFADEDSNAGPSLIDSIIVENQKGGWKVISSKISNIEN